MAQDTFSVSGFIRIFLYTFLVLPVFCLAIPEQQPGATFGLAAWCLGVAAIAWIEVICLFNRRTAAILENQRALLESLENERQLQDEHRDWQRNFGMGLRLKLVEMLEDK